MAWDVLSRAAKMTWDVLSGVTKTAWDVLSGMANQCGMFCPGCQKMAWDVLSRDVLSYIRPSTGGNRKFCEGFTTYLLCTKKSAIKANNEHLSDLNPKCSTLRWCSVFLKNIFETAASLPDRQNKIVNIPHVQMSIHVNSQPN